MKQKNIHRLLTGSVITIIVIAILIYKSLLGRNIKPKENNQVIFIPTGSSYDQVLDSLGSNVEINNLNVFKWIAEKKGYPAMIKPGRYIISNDLSYNELINILRSGRQDPVKVTFNNIRSFNQLAGKIAGMDGR